MHEDWQRETVKLPKNHGWKSKPGYQIFVTEKGAVRFDFPTGWEIVPDEPVIRFFDRLPPDNACTLQFSPINLPADGDWRQLSLVQLLARFGENDDREIIQRGQITQSQHRDIDLVTEEVSIIDGATRRPACSRTLLAYAYDIRLMVTFDFWFDDLARFTPIWETIVQSLQIGRPLEDPRYATST